MANTCAVTAEGGPPCGTVPEQLGSLISLDNLCMRALDGVRRALLADPDPDKHPVRPDKLEAYLAWNALEMGMSVQADREAHQYFDAADGYVDSVLERPDSRLGPVMDVTLLRLYQPLFAGLRAKVPLSADSVTDVRQGLSELNDKLQIAPIHNKTTTPDPHLNWDDHQPCLGIEDERRGSALKIGLYELLARGGVLLYPASPRERGFGVEGNWNLKHDAYVLDGDTKLPINIAMKRKASRANAPGPSVMYVGYQSLVGGAIDALRQSNQEEDNQLYITLRQGSLRDNQLLAQQVLFWLAQEAKLEPVHDEAVAFLDLLTLDLKNRLREHRSYLVDAEDNERPIETFSPQHYKSPTT